jgi:uncharacterized membrane protein (DUF485 family)
LIEKHGKHDIENHLADVFRLCYGAPMSKDPDLLDALAAALLVWFAVFGSIVAFVWIAATFPLMAWVLGSGSMVGIFLWAVIRVWRARSRD